MQNDKLRNEGLISRIAKAVMSKYRKSERNLGIERMDPLYGMTADRAQQIFNQARSGNYAQLQFLYNEIERTDPTLLVCVSRRSAALSELDWKVVQSSERLNRNADQVLVKEQVEFLETAVARIENFPDAVEHLALSAFRGYSHVSPIYRDDKRRDVKRLDLLDSWNFCYDRVHRRWKWNPDASGYADPSMDDNNLKPIPKGELVSVVNKNAIDWPALMIFLRTSVGERDWARFLETYGIPPVILTMPQFTSEQEQRVFEEAAEAVYEGGNGVVPYGTNVSYASESRGTNPFTEFLEHQQKLIVLMATGGTLTSLAESGTGTLGGNAQMDVWMQIVRRDVRIISNAINKQLCEELIHRQFPGRPVLAEFQFDTTPDKITHAKDILELAGMARSAGLDMDIEELSNECGFKLAREQQGDGGMGGMPGIGFDAPNPPSDEPDDDGPNDEPPDGGTPPTGEKQPVPEGAGNDGGMSDERPAPEPGPVVNSAAAKTPKDRERTPAEKLAASLQDQFKDVADRLAEILALPEEKQAEAAGKLLGELDRLVPEDEGMADAIAEVMADAFQAQGLKVGAKPVARNSVPKSCADGDCGCEDDPPGIPNSECHVRGKLCRIHDAKQVEELKARTAQQHEENGSKAIADAVSGQKDVLGAMWRESTGPIDFEYGFAGTPEKGYHDGYGVAHVAKVHSDGVRAIPRVLAHGTVWRHPGSEDKLVVIQGKRIVVLEKDGDGSFMVTGFSPDAPGKYLARFQVGEPLEGVR